MEVIRRPEIVVYRDEKGRLTHETVWYEEIKDEPEEPKKNRCLAWMDDAP